jgi:hypothetical protein
LCFLFVEIRTMDKVQKLSSNEGYCCFSCEVVKSDICLQMFKSNLLLPSSVHFPYTSVNKAELHPFPENNSLVQRNLCTQSPWETESRNFCGPAPSIVLADRQYSTAAFTPS